MASWVEKFSDVIAANQPTILFTNSRRLCEKMTMKINISCGQGLAYSHHGLLSREIRSEVEQKPKGSELKAIVATNSLELGIDSGALDEEFVWEEKTRKIFILGAQHWKCAAHYSEQ